MAGRQLESAQDAEVERQVVHILEQVALRFGKQGGFTTNVLVQAFVGREAMRANIS